MCWNVFQHWFKGAGEQPSDMLSWAIDVRCNGSYFNNQASFVCLGKVVELGEVGVCGDEALPDKRRNLSKLARLLKYPRPCVRLATLLRHVGCCWLSFKNGQIWANNTQHVATHRNVVAKRTQHVAPNNVAICCVGMLRSFGRSLKIPYIAAERLNHRITSIFRKEGIPVRVAHKSYTLRRALSHNNKEQKCTRANCPISSTKLCLLRNAVY